MWITICKTLTKVLTFLNHVWNSNNRLLCRFCSLFIVNFWNITQGEDEIHFLTQLSFFYYYRYMLQDKINFYNQQSSDSPHSNLISGFWFFFSDLDFLNSHQSYVTFYLKLVCIWKMGNRNWDEFLWKQQCSKLLPGLCCFTWDAVTITYWKMVNLYARLESPTLQISVSIRSECHGVS